MVYILGSSDSIGPQGHHSRWYDQMYLPEVNSSLGISVHKKLFDLDSWAELGLFKHPGIFPSPGAVYLSFTCHLQPNEVLQPAPTTVCAQSLTRLEQT